MASDTHAQFCAPNAVFTQGTNHYISINLEKHEQDEARRLFDALSVNGQIEWRWKNFLGRAVRRIHRSVRH
jgi:PhnB protein